MGLQFIGLVRIDATWIAVTIAAGSAGCATTIVPPEQPVAPVPVYVVDYGRHTSLLLPEETRGLTEYAYGDWSWFALDRTEWHNAVPALFGPTDGALGRRHLDVEHDVSAIRWKIPCEEILEITVAGDDVRRLSGELESRFEERSDAVHYQPVHGLTFVRSDEGFNACHNCNHVVAGWLRELGCEVRGSAMTADFTIRESNGNHRGTEAQRSDQR